MKCTHSLFFFVEIYLTLADGVGISEFSTS